MSITNAIGKFARALGRDGKDISDAQVVETPVTAPAELGLVGQLATFYTELSFENVVIGGEFFFKLFSLNQLAQGQLGWRWITVSPAQTKVENPAWESSWIVFGNLNGDALVAKTKDENCPIFGMIQNDEYQLSTSLESFLNIMSDCLIMEQIEYNFDTHEDDFTVYETVIDSTRQIVKKHENDQIAEDYVEFFFG